MQKLKIEAGNCEVTTNNRNIFVVRKKITKNSSQALDLFT